MKKIFSILVGASLALSSCSGDYLDTVPESSIGAGVVFETAENARMAVNGLARMMCQQYLRTQGCNGEGTIKTWYGNYPGNDFQKCKLTGWSSLINMKYTERSTSKYDYYPWFYYYKIIGNANTIIDAIDNAKGETSIKNEVKAQAYVFRAYCYTMLSQLYCKRWVDSNEGSSRGLPLRIDVSSGELPASTLGQVYEQIYADLDAAIDCFDQAKYKREDENFYLPDLQVAYAVYARAALVRNDWATAAEYAVKARENHPLMSAEEYMEGGFNQPNKEWIWGIYNGEEQTLHYYSFFAFQGSNSNANICRNYPCAISKVLYDQIPETDLRREMFVAPLSSEPYLTDGEARAQGIKTYYNEGGTKGEMTKRIKAKYAKKLYSSSNTFAYMQFKFQSLSNPGVGHLNNFRSAEMYLVEAEAKCHLGGKDAEVQTLLKQLNQNLNPAYTCDKTGDDLLEEVKLYRRIELWGEGFDWFDMKRWKHTLDRKTFTEGGSFHPAFAVTLTPEESNNWCWVYPAKEIDFNDALDSAFE